MKKALSLFLTIVLTLGIFCSMPFTESPFKITVNAASSGTCGDNLTWILDDEGTLRISGKGNMDDFKSPDKFDFFSGSPWYHNYRSKINKVIIDYGVTSIGKYAFKDCTNIISVMIPESLKTIGFYSFYNCSNLVSISLNDGLKQIGSYAFGLCTSLTSISIPDSVTSVESSTFSSCHDLKSVVIGNGVTSIGGSAFAHCTNLTSVIIPDGVTNVGSYAFSDCTSLVSLIIPDTVRSLGFRVFGNCSKLKSVTIGDGVISMDGSTFYGCSSLASVKLGKNVTSIGDYTFYDCTNLSSIIIPDGVTSIGNYAFYGCSSLASVKLGKNVTSIGNYAFFGCTNLQSLKMGNKITSIGDYAFCDCESLTALRIPYSVTILGDSSFENCVNVTSISLGDNIKIIGYKAFYNSGYYNNSDNWENGILYINKSVIKANNSVSGECTIVDGTRCIGNYAFSGCTNIESVRFPSTLTNIGMNAFASCNKIKNIYFMGSETEWDKVEIDSGNNYIINSTKHYTKGTCGENLTWTLKDGVLTITGTGEMLNASWSASKNSIVKCVIGDGVTSICSNAFSDCSNLKTAIIGVKVKTIGSQAFENCVKLSSLDIGDNVRFINSYAFRNCDSLSEVIIPDRVTHIYLKAFEDCDSLETVTMLNRVTSIGKMAFNSCDKLTKVILPESLDVIEDNAFYDCKSLEDVYYSGNKYYWECIDIGTGNEWLLSSVIHYDMFVPDKPQISKCYNVSNGIKITWGKVESADSYVVYRKTTGGWKMIADNITATSYKDKTAKNGITYKYTVKAKNEVGLSGYNSTGLSVRRLTTPKLISVANVSSGITVKWRKVTGASGYYVYRKTSKGSWVKIAIVKGNTKVSYTDTKAKAGKNYKYTVKAHYGKSVSKYNTTGLSIKRLTTPKLKSVTTAKAGVTFKWNKVTGASGYIVYRKTGNGSWKQIATVKGNSKVSYIDKNAKKGTTYKYTVKAYYGSSLSAYNTKGLKIKDKY